MKSSPTPDLARQIAAVRHFNRFYTARLGLLRRRHLDGAFALTQARILYEIGANPGLTARTLCDLLELDAGYISRLLSALTRRRLIRQSVSKADGREKLLTLTAAGEKAIARLNQQSDTQIQDLLANLPAADRESLVASLAQARAILTAPSRPSVRIVRLTTATPDALAILEEYYEAVHVVLRDKPSDLDQIIAAPASGIWLAYLADEAVGCVVLRKLPSIPRAAECKRLYVKPSARGHHIAGQLLDAQEAFARTHGIAWIYLDTYDDLKPAIALYKRRGYRPCPRYNINPQATLFLRKRIVN
ncbi:MAG TPA: helix-turn-helix domain-containing GNAT family N-acetyltransferase [Terracidiphilus sp.]|nr:helix-turn-helix domain-containing GNAT family N-acetyltransferase [Terracidiphilus sp.]